MERSSRLPTLIQFAEYTLDTRTGELRKGDAALQLHKQPLEILLLLLESPGQLVTREELRAALWPEDTFLDFEDGLNHAIRRLREALADSPENPRFIQTIPRRGYRFIYPLVGGAALAPHVEPQPAGPTPRRWVIACVAGAIGLSLVLVFAFNVAGLRDRASRTVRALREPPLRIQSLAVLPLENLSRDPEQEYFADGMTEALITDLGKISALRVISRTSVMQYKVTKKPLPQIGRELNVDAVLEGTVARSGNRVRITANLLHAPTDRHLWAEAYESDLSDVLAMQDEVARAIANEVRIKLTPQEQRRLASARTVNPEAYELYLKGRYEWDKRTKEGLSKGLEYFQQAINLAPNYALAHSGVADSYIVLGNNGLVPSVDAYPKARAAALKALGLDENLAEPHASLARVLEDYDWDWLAAEREHQRAIELNPNYATAHHWRALGLALTGRDKEALAEIQLARKLDPLSMIINANIALVLYFGHQYDRAIVEARRALELEPNNAWAHGYLGLIYLQKGMHKESLAEFRTLQTSSLADSPAYALFAGARAAAGNHEEALKIVGQLKRQSKQGYISPSYIAKAYLALGDKDEALAWLQKGLDDHDGPMVSLKVDPELDPLRSDPRFQDLLRRMNFPP